MLNLSHCERYQERMANMDSRNNKQLLTENTPIENDCKISKSLLEQFTKKGLDYETVISNNRELSIDYAYLVKSYGFENFVDLFTFADSCDQEQELVQKGGQKDLSKLKRVTRTVMRNGKPMKTTIYTDGGGEDKGNELDSKSPSEETQTPQPRNANSLLVSLLGMEEEDVPPKQVAQLAEKAKSLQGTFNSDCNAYAVLMGEQGDIGGIIGFRVEKGYLRLVFTQADSVTSGVELKGFTLLTLNAWKKGLGAIMSDTTDKKLLAILSAYDYKKQGDTYKVSASVLKRTLGNP